MRRSGELVRKRWWHTALVTLAVAVLINVFGLIVGLLVLIVFTGLPIWALSVVVVMCNLLVMPFGALVMTFLYGDAIASVTAAPEGDGEMVTEPEFAPG